MRAGGRWRRGASTLVIATALSLATTATALEIRGDGAWRENPHCPPGWEQLELDDSDWTPVEFPWMRVWPYDWSLDPDSRPFWGTALHLTNCVRRTFELTTLPQATARLHILVDDDYDLYLNGQLVAANADNRTTYPGESYDVTDRLRLGRNVIAVRLRDAGGVMAALVTLSLPGVSDPPRSWRDTYTTLTPWLRSAALVLLAALIALLVRWLATFQRRWPPADTPISAWILGLALAVGCEWILAAHTLYTGPRAMPSLVWHWTWVAVALLGFVLLCLRAFPLSVSPRRSSSERSAVRPMVAIVLVAFVLRTLWLDSIPPGFFQDEATNGNDALALSESEFQLWSYSVGGRPTLFLYTLMAMLKLFGRGYLSLKAAPVLFGCAGVLAVYALARLAFDRETALWAALLMAVSRWHIHYSRLAWEAICVPFFSAAGFALLLGSLRLGRYARLLAFGSGVVLALGLYTYASYRGMIAVAVVFALSLGIAPPRLGDSPARRPLAQLLLAAVAGALVTSPLLEFAVRYPEFYWFRYSEVSLSSFMTYFGTPSPWLHQIGRSLLSFNNVGDDMIRHNLPNAPHLDPVTGTFFLLGLAMTVWRWGEIGSRLTLIWFGVFLVIASLTRDGPHSTRLLGLVVPATLLAAIAIREFTASLKRHRLRIGKTVAAVLIVTVTSINAYQYFVLEGFHQDADNEYNFTGRWVCDDLSQRGAIDVYWSYDVAFFSDPQCQFLAPQSYGRGKEIQASSLMDPGYWENVSRPAVIFLGREFLDAHRELLRASLYTPPRLPFASAPRIASDRRGIPQVYSYELEPKAR